jgi:hypothetical protein
MESIWNWEKIKGKIKEICIHDDGEGKQHAWGHNCMQMSMFVFWIATYLVYLETVSSFERLVSTYKSTSAQGVTNKNNTDLRFSLL